MPKRMDGTPVTEPVIPDNDHGLSIDEPDPTTWNAMVRGQDKRDKAGFITQPGLPKRGDWTTKNVQVVLEVDPRFRYAGNVLVAWNALSRTAYCPNPSEDFHVTEADPHCIRALASWLASAYSFPAGDAHIERAILTVARLQEQTFHPVADWLESIDHDGRPRIEDFLVAGFGAEDTSLHRAFGKRFLIGLVARAINPGCKLDTMPMAYGVEGIGKSMGLRALCGSEWFNDTKLPLGDPKRLGMMLQGVWLHEWAELESMQGKSIESVKAMLSSSFDMFVPMFGRNVQKVPRSCVFFGTTNDRFVLQPGHSNRRFWPFETNYVDVEWIESNRVQLLAESRNALLDGEQWWLSREEEEQRREVAKAFTIEDSVYSKVAAVLSGAHVRNTIAFHEVREACKDLGARTNIDADISKAMSALGWSRARSSHGRRVWKRDREEAEVIDLRTRGSDTDP